MFSQKFRPRPENYTWPGFVDALASLLMVIIFVLMVFVIAQFYVSQKLSGKDKALIKMESKIIALNEQLAIEKKVSSKLSSDLNILENKYNDQKIILSQKENLIKNNEKILNLKEFEINKLNEELKNKILVLSNMKIKLDNVKNLSSKKDANFKKTESDLIASKKEIKALLLASKKLQSRINKLKNLLAVYQAKDIKDKVKNLNLGKNLNSALARRVEELQKFKSEFFGRVKEKLKNRPEIKIVGDRFVFQSEVLFQTASAKIEQKGEKELERLGSILLDIEKTLPKDINWILQIEGHTDNLPVKENQEFVDNWELSTERALSVLRFFIKQGLKPERLFASGYGSFKPIDNKNNEKSRSKNRRIEIKITQKLGS